VNQLKVHIQQSIVSLNEQGWSKRKIARELGLDRGTVGKYLAKASKPAISHTGSEEGADPKPAISQAGSAGRPSLCQPLRQQIEQAVAAGLSTQRIYQDLVAEHQFAGSYYAVRRFVRKLEPGLELPFRRMECEAGQETQVDFGQGAWVVVDGKRKRPHLFRMVLSHSRKGYSEVVWRQTTESFIRCLENAFRHFGGVTKTLVIDNLRAAVTRADWFEPELNPKVVAFCEHYGTVILPTKPYTPRHKGKIEAGVKYVQNNALAGRQFDSLNAQNLFLTEWEKNTADTRIHGTTKKQVGKIFMEVEKPALLPLPPNLFPTFEEGQRTVHRDGYIELQKAYYSVPPEYVGRKVWVRWEPRLVRVFNSRMVQIALHTRHEPGKFATDPAHIHDHKRTIIERGADWLLDRARLIGTHSGTWAEKMFAHGAPQGMRVLQGLLQLAEKHPVAQLERACQLATQHGAWRLHDIKELLARATPPPQQQFTFLESHELIRDLKSYENLVPVCFDQNTATETESQNA